MASENEFMLGIAAAVADGTAIDWTRAEAQTRTEEDRRVLRSLRLLAEISTVHDSVGDEQTAPATSGTHPGGAIPADDPGGNGATIAPPLKQWGRYQLREELGAGAQGAVYRAWDPQLDREVALKLFAGSESHLLTEARLLARVRHPNIAVVHGAGLNNSRVGLWMEFIPGRTLAAIVRDQGRFEAREAALIGLDICHALAVLHRAGVIHGDVKAQNVMREDGGRTVLMDFGLGRDLRAKAGPSTLSVLAGTPPYMAPELLAGEKPSAQSDVYALGVMLHFLVTAKYPTTGRTVDEVRSAHAAGDVRKLRNERPDLPDDFVRAVERATAPGCDQRFSSAEEFAEALNASAGQAAVRPRWMPRVAAAAALVILAILGAVYIWPENLAQRPWILVADFENQTAEPYLDLTARELLTLALEQSRHFNVFPRSRAIESFELMRLPKTARLDLAVAGQLARRENISAVIGGAIASTAKGYEIVVRAADGGTDDTRAVIRETLAGKDELAKAVDRIAVGLRRSLGEKRFQVARNSRPLERVTTSSFEALRRYSQGVDAYSQGQTESALDWLKSAVDQDPEFAMAHRQLATIYSALGRYDEALTAATRAWSLRQRTSERERHLIDGIYNVRRGDFVPAVDSYRLVTVLYPQDSVALYQLAQLQALLRDYTSAVNNMTKAADLNPRSTFYQGLLAVLQFQANQPAQALERIRRARSNGADGPYLNWCEGLTWLAKEDFTRAEQVLGVAQQGGGVYDSLSRMALAQGTILRGKLDEAASQLESDVFVHLKNGHQLHATRTRFWLASLYVLMNQKTRALTQVQFIDTAAASPSSLTSLRQAGLIYARLGAVAQTQIIVNRLEEIATAYPSIYTKGVAAHVRGELERSEGRLDSSRRDLELGWTLWGDVLSSYSLAQSYQANGDFSRALEIYRKIVRQKELIVSQEFTGIWVDSLLQTARCLRKLSRFAEAAKYYDEFLKHWGTASSLTLSVEAKQERQSLSSFGL